MASIKDIWLGEDVENPLLFLFISLVIIAIFWLTVVGLKAGDDYFRLIILIVLIWFLTLFLFKKSTEDTIRVPISNNANRAVFMIVFGVIVYLVLSFGFSFFGQEKSVFAVFKPLASFSSGVGSFTYSILAVQNSPGWYFFIVGVAAPILEEFVLGMGFVWLGILITYSLASVLTDITGINFKNKHIYFIGGIILSVFFFSILHVFNASYTLPDGSVDKGALIGAGIFRLGLNLIIYLLSWGLEFGIGVHSTNNWLDMFRSHNINGADYPPVLPAAFTSWQGYMVLIIVALLVTLFIKNYRKMIEQLSTLVPKFY